MAILFEAPLSDVFLLILTEQKRKHFVAVKRIEVKKSALCQHVVDFDHFIAWDEAIKLKMEANYRKRRTAESFFINRK